MTDKYEYPLRMTPHPTWAVVAALSLVSPFPPGVIFRESTGDCHEVARNPWVVFGLDSQYSNTAKKSLNEKSPLVFARGCLGDGIQNR